VPQGKVSNTPVTLIDSYPTIVDAVGGTLPDTELDGESLWSIAQEEDAERVAFSEYHAVGSQHGSFMVTDGRTKLIHYANQEPQLFDLLNDSRARGYFVNSPTPDEEPAFNTAG